MLRCNKTTPRISFNWYVDTLAIMDEFISRWIYCIYLVLLPIEKAWIYPSSLVTDWITVNNGFCKHRWQTVEEKENSKLKSFELFLKAYIRLPLAFHQEYVSIVTRTYAFFSRLIFETRPLAFHHEYFSIMRRTYGFYQKLIFDCQPLAFHHGYVCIVRRT